MMMMKGSSMRKSEHDLKSIMYPVSIILQQNRSYPELLT